MDVFELEHTFALIKPDAIRVGKQQEIMHIIEFKGFGIVARRWVQVRTLSGTASPKPIAPRA